MEIHSKNINSSPTYLSSIEKQNMKRNDWRSERKRNWLNRVTDERQGEREKSDYRKQMQLTWEEASGDFILGKPEITKMPFFLNSIFY